jgi:hypothetical protein
MTKLIKIFVFLPIYIIWLMAFGFLLFGVCKPCYLGPSSIELLSMLIYVILLVIPLRLFYLWVWAEPRWVKKVQSDGKQAIATILSIKNTGLVINNSIAVVNLKLRIQPSDDAAFEISKEKEVSMIPGIKGYSVGEQVKVKYDPNNKHHLVICETNIPSNHYAESHSMGTDITYKRSEISDKLMELSKLHESGELSDSEFTAAKKKLLY